MKKYLLLPLIILSSLAFAAPKPSSGKDSTDDIGRGSITPPNLDKGKTSTEEKHFPPGSYIRTCDNGKISLSNDGKTYVFYAKCDFNGIKQPTTIEISKAEWTKNLRIYNCYSELSRRSNC
jgi:hypothetical protein